MHPNAPKRGLRAAPGHNNPIQTITMGFKICRAFDWLLTLRWFDEFAGHIVGHYDGLKICPAFTVDLEHARQTITIILQRARPWAFNSSLRSIGPAARFARLIHH